MISARSDDTVQTVEGQKAGRFHGRDSGQIPDSDELLGDLTSLGYKFDSSARLQIESKDDLRKRGMKSPDTADSLALTFHVGDYLQQGGFSVTRIPDKANGMFI